MVATEYAFADLNCSNIVDLVRSHAASTPERPAIIDGARTVTYFELQALIARYAGYLGELGVKSKDRLGLVLQDHADHLILMLTAASMGAASVSINWRGKVEEKRAVAEALAVDLLIHDPDVRVPENLRALQLDDVWRQNADRAAPLDPVPFARDLAMRVLLTSGSTGVPKGVELSHKGVLVWRESLRTGLGIEGPQRHFSAYPLAFTGTFNLNLPHLLLGNTVELFPPLFSPGEFVDAVRKRGVTSCMVVPTTLRQLMPLAQNREPLLPELRYLISLGAPLTPDERREAKRKLAPEFFDGYGASGAGFMTFLRPADIDKHADSVGRAAPLRNLQVVDEHDRPLPAGETGLLRCSGEGVASGFCGLGDATASEAFRDGWYYPGEIARIAEDGFVYPVGRASEVILRGGSNVYPAEIEQTLMRHPGVIEAAVIGVPSPEYGEEVVAFVRVSEATPERDLLETCRRYLSHYKVPAEIILIDQFPRTAAGKVIKTELLGGHQSKRA